MALNTDGDYYTTSSSTFGNVQNTVWYDSSSTDGAVSNPFSTTNVMNKEMREQEAKQRRVEDGRPDEVKDILRKIGYNVK